MESVHILLDSVYVLWESVYIHISKKLNCAFVDSPIKRLVESKVKFFWLPVQAASCKVSITTHACAHHLGCENAKCFTGVESKQRQIWACWCGAEEAQG